MGKIIFALNEGDVKPSTWSIAQDSVMAEKPGGLGMKFIAYYKGANSCFVEDIENKDLKPSKVPDFEYNTQLDKTVLEVDENNLALIKYLKTHSWYGTKVVLFSAEGEANSKLSQYEKVEKAIDLIKESDEAKIKANALAVLGLDYFYKTNNECLADLKEKAFNSPDVIITAMEADDYQNKYVAALAFASGIIKNNMTNTAVVWSEGEGVLVHVAQGENGLDKLTEFLKRNSEESEVLLQEFQNRLDKKATAKVTPKVDTAELKAKDDRIAELENQLAKAKVNPNNINVNDYETVAKEDTKPLEELQKEYQSKFEKEVPARFKNDKTWIAEKLSE